MVVVADMIQQANGKGRLVPMVRDVLDNQELAADELSTDPGYWVTKDI